MHRLAKKYVIYNLYIINKSSNALHTDTCVVNNSFQGQFLTQKSNKTLKGNWGKSFTPVFISDFCKLYGQRGLYKVLWQSDKISRSYKVTKFCIQGMWGHTYKYIEHVTPGFLCIFCCFCGAKNTYNKVLSCFRPFFTNL